MVPIGADPGLCQAEERKEKEQAAKSAVHSGA